jgi:E3 ubiquitin-protein ligase HUWE1
MQVTDYELIPGGRNIKVTEENKHQYVDLVAEHRLTTAIRPQINAFLDGFNELIVRELISIFNDKELELLISGLPDIDCEFPSRYLFFVDLNMIFPSDASKSTK